MKKLIFSLGILASGLVMAQESRVDSTFLKNWMHSDYEATGVYGVNTQRAKDFLKEKKRKPQNIVVGVLDSGVEYFHEDLKNVMWKNPKEKKNGKDSDKNGYVDDIHGWNFLADKDGKNYAEDNLELTRQYAKWDRYFKENATASKNSAEYKKYLSLKKDYLKTTAKFQLTKEVAEARINYIKPRIEALKSVLGEQKITKSILDNLVSENNLALEGLSIFSELNEKDWDGKNMEEIGNLYLNRYQRQLDYANNQMRTSYNLSLNPQEGIGKIYGNSDVKGLSDEHGTHVAAIIAGDWENNKGIKGTGGGNYVKIMGVRVVPEGDERDLDIANGIRYAVDNGAKILNMSFGKSVDDNHKLVVDAFRYAEEKNVLIVKAAGNDNLDVDINTKYPITLIDDKQYSPITITVGANTRHNDKLRARFSNYGKKSVDVFGPGMEIYSAIPGGNKYTFFNGTSMASPAVAGVAALVWSHYPKLSAKDIRNIIVSTTNKNDQLKEISVSGGVVDAYKAVQKAEEMYKQRKLK